jgi:glycosyltransferase involved in cell wall biosynthesis
LRDATRVMFTAQEECRLARESFRLYRVNEEVVAFGTSQPPADAAGLREAFYARHPDLRGKRLILFLGRIHPKKGCDLLLQAFAAVRELAPEAHLVMAGPDGGEWIPTLKTLGAELGISSRVTWAGMLQGDQKWGAFYASDAFVLPSHQENFGIAVAEALACGLPALISDKVNIWREVEADGAGFVAPDTVAGTLANLTRWLRLDATQAVAMRKQALQCFEQHFTVDAMSADLLRVLQEGRRKQAGDERSLALKQG